MKISIPSLKPGQEVLVMNCATTGRVVRRTGAGKYLVSWNGHEIEMVRSKHNLVPLGQKHNY